MSGACKNKHAIYPLEQIWHGLIPVTSGNTAEIN